MNKVSMILDETFEQAAHRLFAKQIAAGYALEALHPYEDSSGKLIFVRIRLKHKSMGDKIIRPICLSEQKTYILKEPKFTNGKPIYHQPDIANYPDKPVYLVEGEWCADGLSKLGLIATTSGSCTTGNSADWSPLRGRKIIIWPDNDDPGLRYATEVSSILLTLDCQIHWIDIEKLKLPLGGDCIDWLNAHPLATLDDINALPTLILDAEKINDEDSSRTSQASALVKFVQDKSELFHDQNKLVYAKDRTTNEVRRLDSRQFHDWLVSSFYETTGKSPRDQSVRETLSTLSGLGRYKGDRHNVHVRVAAYEGCYFLDLAEPGQSRAIRIAAGHWEIINDPPVMFIRSESMCPLPEPRRGGNIQALWRIANIPKETQLLVLAWLCECLRPNTPFPALELLGEQGSAKSTTQSALRQLIDPNTCNLRSMPKTVEDIFVSAGVSWLTSYENISYLSAPMQDALCVLATGGGFAKRKLYSDADESVIHVHRPIVLNGISAAITAQDLIDRTISIETPIITERVETTGLWNDFAASYSELLGALLDILANALEKLPMMQLSPEDRPRLIEFARLGMAVAEATGQDSMEFMRQFQSSRQESIARTIDASPVATAVVEWYRDHPAGGRYPAKEFMVQIERYKPQQNESWPRSPKGFADALRRSAPALRQLGIECHSLSKTGGTIIWIIEPRENFSNPCPASPECPSSTQGEQDIRTSRTSVPEFSLAEVQNNHIEAYNSLN